ncbi:MAG: malto-oligosyltrehalose trehalohydrolase [Deltaproteobacteria bacterium]|nr:malto-oligosyltrehalose trehalohydrolase [Deltaproteobacteria bacterium]
MSTDQRLAPKLGPTPLGEGRCRFCVWAPFTDSVEVHLLSPRDRLEPLARDRHGYHCGVLDDVKPGSLYLFRLDRNQERPDPASHFQPRGVHGPSQVVDPAFDWTDGNWRGLPLHRYIFYELHVGTFTTPGTFDAAIERLDDLVTLGITAVELMPVAQFPGERNWGYDGVYPFAAQNSYGGPQGLKRFVNACHARGLAVVLDVVYNHLGPEGNYFRDFGPYFSDIHQTPWGAPINFDGPYSDEVHRYFIENALYWVTACHIDALRLDAVHAILDFSAQPFLRELAKTVKLLADGLGRHIHLIAESDLNDTRLIRQPELGGFGLDAQWNDDLHHALHTVLTDERRGYYGDFGRFDQLLKALREGFVYDGQYSGYRKRRHGNSSRSIPGHRFVVFSQNHDQVGNRMQGDRLGRIVSFEALKMAAGIILLSANLPLLFMGEEYGETAPFPYFVSHSDPGLIEAVREGRRKEFAAFGWEGDPPDPQAEETFFHAKPRPELRLSPGPHRHLWEFYCRLIAFRKSTGDLFTPDPAHMEVFRAGRKRIGVIRRWNDTEDIGIVFHAGDKPVSARVPLPAGCWRREIDSAEAKWGGSGSALAGTIDSEGEIEMELSPYAFLMLSKQVPER